MSQVDWPAHGFDGCKLGYLVNQIGRFHTPHGAGGDVDAMLTLLAHTLDDGRTALSHVVEAASLDAWRVSAVGAPIAMKDDLKRRGYRWNADMKVWWREVGDEAKDGEAAWLAENVYGERGRVLGLGARWDRLDHRRRFA